MLEWLRLPGDVVFIVGGVLRILYLCWLSIRYMVPGGEIHRRRTGDIIYRACGTNRPRLMTQTIDTEVLLAGLYAVFLLLVALGLELVARHAHHRSKQMRIAGFRYHRHHDVWECPAGQPVATDYARRLVRYRAPAHACNVCSIKHLCTESKEGREIEHSPDSWLESEIARFHRGISLALLFLAGCF